MIAHPMAYGLLPGRYDRQIVPCQSGTLYRLASSVTVNGTVNEKNGSCKLE